MRCTARLKVSVVSAKRKEDLIAAKAVHLRPKQLHAVHAQAAKV